MIERGLHIADDFSGFLIQQGVDISMVAYIRLIVLLFVLALLVFIIDFFAKKIVVESVKRIFTFTKNKWDDVLIEKKVFNRLAHLVPAFIISWATPFLFKDFPFWISIIHRIIEIYVTAVILAVTISFFNALEFYFTSSKKFKDKPIESYFQLTKLIAYFIGGVFILSIALGKSPIYFLSAFGAISAVLLLLFKDTILGFVASIQIAANDMLKVNDWVEMPKYGADGDITKITLNTVKVRNFDNTITTIPTYAFVSDSFKNWRGMQETGARRIKRHIYIRPRSIKFLEENELKSFDNYQIIKDYVNERQKEINSHNSERNIDKSTIVNGRNQTNIGVFRKYAELYLRQHPLINQDMTLMVRHLQPNQYGLPLEIYCFAKTTQWVVYEEIQADIMDHLMSAIKAFGLEIYELSAVND